LLDIAAAFLDGLGTVGNGNPSIDGLRPAPITGSYLAKNKLPEAARVALALRLLRGGETISEPTVAQVSFLCRVSRSKVDVHLRRHRNVGAALARAFQRASDDERLAFVQAAGIEAVWHVLTQAV
jgi:hypothetical protein